MIRLFFLLLGLCIAFPGFAFMDSETSALMDRLDRLERDLTLLQRKIYQTSTDDSAPSKEHFVTGSVEHLYTKIAQIEEQAQALTQQHEGLTHDIEKINEQLTSLRADIQIRFEETEKKLALQEQQIADLRKLYEGQPKALPTPQNLYDEVQTALQSKNYEQAQALLEQFLATYEQDALAGNAQYWLGETFYARQKYEDATAAFAACVKKYADSTKAPDCLLKLGLSLKQSSSKEEACTALASLPTTYPKADKALLEKAANEAKTLSCP